MRRLLIGTVAVVLALALAIGTLVFINVRGPFPDVTGERTISGLTADVTIGRDAHGIPQVEAEHELDLFFGQGFVHAQDRFYEMDFRRHVTSGRLAELVGEGALETDQFVRTLGWRRVAEQEYRQLDEPTRKLLRAYARGVNAYIDNRSGSDLALEYTVLSLTGPDYRPEPWTPVDSLAWVKAMAWDLRSNMNDEIGRVQAAEDLTTAQVEELWPGYPEDHATIVGGGEVTDGSFRADDAADARRASAAVDRLGSAQRAAEAVPALLGTGDGIGSNSWVVSGDRTATGKPILANDPHLAPSMPGIWYQVGLRCRQVTSECPYDVAGYSFSGLPGVVVGHNRKVAWGVTTMYADVADLYLERVDGETYEFEGEQLPLETREETFEVAGGEPETITVRETRHGPILSDLDENISEVGSGTVRDVEKGDYAVSLQWTALTPRPTIKAVFALGRAQDWEDFRDAAELFTVPSQNLVYADVDGNIGYQSPGAIPIRSRGNGRYPAPGWTGTHEWTGEIPFEELPSVLNPDEGAIVTANNRVIGSYPYTLGADTAAGYRSERIRDLLQAGDGFDVADMTAMQTDTHNGNAERLVPYLLDVELGDEFDRQGQDTLRGWDFSQPPDSSSAAYFNVVWRHLLELTFHDQLPPEQHPDGGERWFNVLDRIIDDEESRWWDDVDTPGVEEDRDVILAEAMRRARDELTRRQSREPEDWTWGRLHRLELVNQTLGTSGIGLVEGLFNRGPYELGGGTGIVDATGWDAREGYDVTAVPSMRMVVDLANLDRSRWINLTGASGHAYHPHYVDQTELWARGETLPWAFSGAAVEAATEETLVLRPGG
ncbi:penicillin acylase family protein [Aeromicrobium sp. CF4.19]|uniref:penicillin acylase family protein n=1 Tax=Aeromicrobium sp. CF4.19 TaxID=3373082 RepID=UPI003EE6FB66